MVEGTICCTKRWIVECRESCAKELCDNSAAGTWIPRDFSIHQYTCQVDGNVFTLFLVVIIIYNPSLIDISIF